MTYLKHGLIILVSAVIFLSCKKDSFITSPLASLYTSAKKFTVFVLSVTNVLGFNKVYTYNYSFNNQHKLAVTPPSKRFIYLGCFISFGIDRSQDEINNHL